MQMCRQQLARKKQRNKNDFRFRRGVTREGKIILVGLDKQKKSPRGNSLSLVTHDGRYVLDEEVRVGFSLWTMCT